MKLCWFGCGILAVLLALSLLCGMLTQRSTRDAAAALEQALCSGGDFSEIFVEDRESNNVSMIDGTVDEASYNRSRGAGVRVLRDGWTLLEREGETLTLYGMERKRPRPLPAACPRPVIALAHQPQWLYLYEAAGWDLVISGHAHGGQVRLIGQGLYAPGQGMLPPFTSGLYRRGNTQMAVSRGLGNSTFSLRFGNRLHLPVLVLG